MKTLFRKKRCITPDFCLPTPMWQSTI